MFFLLLLHYFTGRTRCFATRLPYHPNPCQTQPPSPSVFLPPGHLANASTELMKLDHEEEPQLSEPYLSKQKKLMVNG